MAAVPPLYLHPTLNITAPAPYWKALGAEVYNNTDVVQLPYDRDIDQAILIGLEETSANDHRPLVWAMQEIQRRREARDQTAALGRLAEALHTIRVPADLDVAPLERAVDRLTSTLTQNAHQFTRRPAHHTNT